MGLFGDGAARRARRAQRRAEKEAFRLEKMGVRTARQSQRQGFLKDALPTLVPGVKDLLGGLSAHPGADGTTPVLNPAPPKDPMKAGLPLLLGAGLLLFVMNRKKGGF